MKRVVLIEKTKEGLYSVYAPDLEDVVIGTGNTVEEAKADFENSMQEMIQYKEEKGFDTHGLKKLRFEYKFDLASLFNFYNWINVSKFAKIAGINASLMRQYKAGAAYISESQSKKIEGVLHRLGHELSEVRL